MTANHGYVGYRDFFAGHDLKDAQEMWEEMMMSALTFKGGNIFEVCADALIDDMATACLNELDRREAEEEDQSQAPQQEEGVN